jgi:hypothetical protein
MPLSTISPVTTGTATSATLDQALTAVLTLSTRGYQSLWASIAISVQATDQFTIGVKARQDQAAYVVTHTGASDYTTPYLPLIYASESLADIAAGATAWLLMDVRGIEVVQFSTAFAVDNGTYLIDYCLQ